MVLASPLIVTPVSGTDISSYKLSLVPHTVVGRVEVFGEAGYYRMKIDAHLGLPDDDLRRTVLCSAPVPDGTSPNREAFPSGLQGTTAIYTSSRSDSAGGCAVSMVRLQLAGADEQDVR